MAEGELAVAQTLAHNKTLAELNIVKQQLLEETRNIVPDQFDIDEYEREIKHLQKRLSNSGRKNH
jgi:hypothetical protein